MNIAEELVSRIPGGDRAEYAAVLSAARLDDVGAPDAEQLAEFVGPALALLDRVGNEGIALSVLTRGGADDSPALRSVRDQLIASSLVRGQDGTLSRTAIGTAIASEPDGARAQKAWRHLASTIANAGHEIRADGVTLLLLLIASGTYGPDYQERIAAGLTRLGWRTTDGEPLDQWDAFESVVAQYRFLSHAGAVADTGRGTGATEIGAAFARAALRVEAA